MYPAIIGISGSPVPNSNTDRLIRIILHHAGIESDFIKLSTRTIRPCMGCLGCVNDNKCKVPDDFPPLAESIKSAKALVIGGYPPYGSLDAFTKAFLERLFSLRHQKGLNRGKLAITIVTGNGRGTPGIQVASDQLHTVLSHEGMEILGRIQATGNVKCTHCGAIVSCPMSALPRLFENTMGKVPQSNCKVEDQPDVWGEAIRLGKELGERLRIAARQK